MSALGVKCQKKDFKVSFTVVPDWIEYMLFTLISS